MKCYLTGHKIYNLNLNEKSDQIFIDYNYKYKNAEKNIEVMQGIQLVPTLIKMN